MPVPPPNTVLDSDGLEEVRFFTVFDPVYADVDNRPLSDLRARDARLQAQINAITGVSSTAANFLQPNQNTTPDNRVFVQEGVISYAGGTESRNISANFASSITFPPVVTPGNSRFDLLGVNISGPSPAPQRIAGTESPAPSLPAIPEATLLPICYVLIDETGTVIVADADITDIRPFLAVPNQRLNSADEKAALVGAGGFAPSPTNLIVTEDFLTSVVDSLKLNDYAGLQLSNNAGDPNHDIDISVGLARSDDDTDGMVLTAPLVKQLDANFTEGTGNGGLDTGTILPFEFYAVWLIKRLDTNVVDVLFSLNFSTPTLPAPYTKKRLIGALVTDGLANIIPFIQSDIYFRFLDPIVDISDTTLTDNTYETGNLTVPPHCLAHIYGNIRRVPNAGLFFLWLRTVGAVDDATVFSEAWVASSANDNNDLGREGHILVDGNSNIEYAVELGTNSTVTIRTLGFTMHTIRTPK